MSRKQKNKENDKRKGNNILRIIFIIMTIAFIIISIRFYYSIINMNMLPSLYTIIFTVIIAVITVLLVIGLSKKHKTLKLNIICLILIIIMSSIYVFANKYVDVTMEFLSKILTEIVEVEEYYVVVKADSQYNDLNDIKNEEVYVFQVENEITEKIFSNTNVEIRFADNLVTLGNELVNNQIDAIVVSSSQYTMLSDQIENFASKTKIIKKEMRIIENQATIEDANSKYTIKDKVFNIYISGIDTFGNIEAVSRSDANMVATINLNTHEVHLTSIPRDYYVTLHSKKAKDKLTHSGNFGIAETVTTVEDLLDIDINYYLRINFTTVIKLVDALGGIDVYSEYEFSRHGYDLKNQYNFKKGYNHLNGEAALLFSRERLLIPDGDNQRIKNQQKVIEAIMNKVLNSKTILTKYTDILNSLSQSFNTNIDQDELSNIVKMQLESMPKWKITEVSLTGKDAERTTYSLGTQPLYVMLPDNDSIEHAKDEINRVMQER